jgi:stearoyl-CoA desaturase (delta-9 desaturase)
MATEQLSPPTEGPGGRALPEVGSRADVFANVAVTVVPFLLVLLAAVEAWNGWLHWQDVVVFVAVYIPIGFGVTVGYHRLFTHRSFKTSAPMRAFWGILGSAAVEGPVIEWVAYHRKHHAFSDEEGDPHSPHVGHGTGWRGALKGLWHAHVGWVWFSDMPAEEQRYAPDLMKDPVVRMVDRTFLLWVLAGLALPFGLGVALTGRVSGGLTALLWGGAVRIFLCHQLTFSINSLCHYFGRRDYATDDESRNLAWLAPFTLGEAWHNNHHAFPTSARHGLEPWQLDFSGLLIGAMERVGLVWDVVRVAPERRAAKVA